MKTLMTTLTVLLTIAVSDAHAQYTNSSGMLLGVYCQPFNNGMSVSSLIPGYSAEGRLFPGDIMMRATLDGNTLYSLRSHWEMERAKTAIGANRDAALEIYRPGQGYVYIWVQFTPLYGVAATGANGQKQFGARYKTEREKPGARNLFQRSGSGGNMNPPGSRPGPPQNFGTPGRTSGSGGAAKLFGK